MDEKTLVERRRGTAEGTPSKTLVRMYNRKVFALAYGFVRDQATADDLAQEIFLKVYQALPIVPGRIRVRHLDLPDRRQSRQGSFAEIVPAEDGFARPGRRRSGWPSRTGPRPASGNARRKNAAGARFSGSWRRSRRNTG